MRKKPVKYADGGKVVEREYGKPTYGKALLARVGIGDGYGSGKSKAKKALTPVRDAVAKPFAGTIANRKKMLDDI